MGTGDRRVVVDGDVSVDWHLAVEDLRLDEHARLETTSAARGAYRPSGAALLADLLEAVVAADPPVAADITRGPLVVAATTADPSSLPCRYLCWTAHPFAAGPGRADPAWRVAANLGIEHRAAPTAPADESSFVTPLLVVLDDNDLGFRDDPGRWSPSVAATAPGPWILLSTTAPVATGPLWEHLHRHHAERLVVVLTLEHLRHSQVQVSRQLSWERTAQDLAWELVHNPAVNAISRCRYAVVSLGAAGALVVSHLATTGGSDPRPELTLLFDPAEIEGSWESDRPGGMVGTAAALTAGIARSMLGTAELPDIVAGVRAGLTGVRALHREGFGQRGASAETMEIDYPYALVAGAVAEPDPCFAAVTVPSPAHRLSEPDVAPTEPGWTILRDRHPEQLDALARRIVERGPAAVLRDVPLGRFGPLLSVDRDEIESLRSIRSLVAEYVAQDKPARPLSIAVFGAPGAGKSFAVTSVANTLLPGRLTKIECNLSQLEDPVELDDVLHRARDAGLKGDLPLVFWDEFDAPLQGRPLGWLRYFLAPMQDGEFRQGQVVHPIGRAVFVFAGGTAHRLAELGSRLGEDAFVSAKGPDFVSRLRGSLDVAGPNPRFGADGTADPYHIVRRAVLLHSLLRRKAPGLVNTDGHAEWLSIDPGVLRAMLQVSAYRHGARSMEAVLDMSRLTDHTTFERSSLPSEAQLDLHVDGREFLSIVQRLELGGDLLERLAEAAHEVFCAGLRDRGYTFAPVTDDERRVSAKLRPYGELDEEDKEQNRGNVRDIADKLAVAGYAMVPARGAEEQATLPEGVVEALAEMEHVRWMRAKLAAGWEYGSPTDARNKRHEALRPWWDLPEYQRVKDRDMVNGIPRILAKAGYTVVPAGD